MKLFLKIWRQKNNQSKGSMIDYEIDNISPERVSIKNTPQSIGSKSSFLTRIAITAIIPPIVKLPCLYR